MVGRTAHACLIPTAATREESAIFRIAFALVTLAALALPFPNGAHAAGSCRFVLGFAAFHDLIPARVGDCADDEQHNPGNGDALQHTTGGLLVWRKADNFTAFTDGTYTWVAGPHGIEERLNARRFSWEANPDGLPLADGPAARGHVTAIGDSVMLGAAGALRQAFGDVDVDAAVSRQVSAGIAVLAARLATGTLGPTVVIHLGTNGTFTAGQLDQIMRILSGERRVVIVNDRADRSWTGPNNAMLAADVPRYPNARLADWYDDSAGQSGLFWGDGIHVRPGGAALYARLIADTVDEP